MNSWSHFVNSVKKLNTQEVKDCIEQVHHLSGKSKPSILLDMALCVIRYQAGYKDYTIFGMYNMTDAQRKNILTRGKNNQYIEALNAPEDRHYFENKIEFMQTFANEIGREYLDLTTASFDDFADFFGRHGQMIAKPEAGLWGRDIERIDPGEENGVLALYNRFKTGGQPLIEEVLEQHVAIDALYSGSVNTVRLVTMLDDEGKPHLLYAAMRLGRSGSVVDNFHSGGIIVPIDIKKGTLIGIGATQAGESFENHPDTGMKFNGYFLPYWKEVLTITARATQKVPTVRLVGWDIAITPKGPVLVAGTPTPGHDIYQLVPQNPEKKGMLPVFDKAVPYETVKNFNKEKDYE
jgi:glutathione synthase/RimK-type ligase-like ATP-grasp enzyme